MVGYAQEVIVQVSSIFEILKASVFRESQYINWCSRFPVAIAPCRERRQKRPQPLSCGLRGAGFKSTSPLTEGQAARWLRSSHGN